MEDLEMVNEVVAMLLEFGYDVPEEIADLQCDLTLLELEN